MAPTLYEQDFYAWTREQAERLRGLRGVNDLDIEHLAEEIEDLGKAERDAVRSQIRRILVHFLELRYSTAHEARRGWKGCVIDARDLLADKITASLRADAEANFDRLYRQARRSCAAELEEYGEAPDLPEACPFTLDEILTDDSYPAPKADS